ncbi:MAG: cytochrome c biogenesis protein CcsA [Prevotella sp.]|nr:cytochrome c biogenesis protein CcsA [Prevotella sp.]
MKNLKKLIMALYILIIVCIGFATVIEKERGTAFVGEHIYGSWWFVALWALLVVAACGFMLKQRLYKRAAVMLLHLSFVVILAGALITHLFSQRGSIRLRMNVAEKVFIDNENKVVNLPFSLTLKDFRVVNYPGTDAPLDYQSVILAGDVEVVVSMNHIGNIQGYRLFQQKYDSDGEGVTLGVCHDPYGIAVTYMGYLLLILGIVGTLLSRQTQMRSLYRKAITLALLLFCVNASAKEVLPVVPKDIAHRLGSINVLYNNRICPLNTVATDFVTRLSGSASWNGYSADEIFTSWMIYYSPWERQKLIRVKSTDVQQLLGIDSQWASFSDFVNENHEYKLKDVVSRAVNGSAAENNRKALLEADEKYHLVEMFYQGQLIRPFPYAHQQNGETRVSWYAPGSQTLPKDIPVKEQFFIKQSMDFLTESIVTGQDSRALEIIAKIKLFQRDMIGDILPSEIKTKAEIAYNSIRSQKWPVFLSLSVSLLLCVLLLFVSKESVIVHGLLLALNGSLFAWTTLLLGLRWWVGGHIPVSNGHETMLFMAWVTLLLTIILRRKFKIILGFGALIASFCLLVAMLAGAGSQLTPLMPVLQSPLLSIHVVTVMIAYALFALQVLLGVYAWVLIRKNGKADTVGSGGKELERVTALSQFLLYPAVFLLTTGIFLGAVWANVSWGNYWSWDPKESWALITLMVYAVPLHKASVGVFRKPLVYHIYMVSAFVMVLITYFGVNYLLGGMHSYANG